MRTNIKDKAINLRHSGYSYGYIMKQLGISSKGTLSYWFKDLVLTKETKLKLEENQQKAIRSGLMKSNEIRSKRIHEENNQEEQAGENLIKNISKRELMLIGASLYWGEGTKSTRFKQYSLSFSNSDHLMINLYIKFITHILEVDKKRIRAGIHMYDGMNINECRKFWSTHTGLPKDRFFIVMNKSNNKNNTHKTPYGTAVIKVNNRKLFFKVKGLISGIIKSHTNI